MDEEASYQIQNNRSQVAEGGLVLVAKNVVGIFCPYPQQFLLCFRTKNVSVV